MCKKFTDEELDIVRKIIDDEYNKYGEASLSLFNVIVVYRDALNVISVRSGMFTSSYEAMMFKDNVVHNVRSNGCTCIVYYNNNFYDYLYDRGDE